MFDGLDAWPDLHAYLRISRVFLRGKMAPFLMRKGAKKIQLKL
jgi:hypothetical protein